MFVFLLFLHPCVQTDKGEKWMPCKGIKDVASVYRALRFYPDMFTGHAHADRDGAEDVQAERVCLPQHERCCPEEQTDEHDARAQVCGGGNQEPLSPEEVTTGLQSAIPKIFPHPFSVTGGLCTGFLMIT